MKTTLFAIVTIGWIGASMPNNAVGQAPGRSSVPPLNDNVDPDPRFSAPGTNIIRRQATTLRPQTTRLQPQAIGSGFDATDPTQSAPDMRRILEGDQQQVRRAPLPPIDVVGKVIRADGTAKAMLRVNERYFIISKGTSFSVNSGADPIVFTVGEIDITGVTITSMEDQQQLRLP